ncbi:hypothetical protein FRAAL5439 [Frankia alni ACN14a]|uniref:Uncharacterized protein n=1 Tax=Frankia alni (strain DSM 45986 / CECT 9034 / ACN14a) TaxID=326424 RepID=Q0REN6_FRAAA|nr:hypothetical protein FRAAL5439 [Frankia alni ACN14a]
MYIALKLDVTLRHLGASEFLYTLGHMGESLAESLNTG